MKTTERQRPCKPNAVKNRKCGNFSFGSKDSSSIVGLCGKLLAVYNDLVRKPAKIWHFIYCENAPHWIAHSITHAIKFHQKLLMGAFNWKIFQINIKRKDWSWTLATHRHRPRQTFNWPDKWPPGHVTKLCDEMRQTLLMVSFVLMAKYFSNPLSLVDRQFGVLLWTFQQAMNAAAMNDHNHPAGQCNRCECTVAGLSFGRFQFDFHHNTHQNPFKTNARNVPMLRQRRWRVRWYIFISYAYFVANLLWEVCIFRFFSFHCWCRCSAWAFSFSFGVCVFAVWIRIKFIWHSWHILLAYFSNSDDDNSLQQEIKNLAWTASNEYECPSWFAHSPELFPCSNSLALALSPNDERIGFNMFQVASLNLM